MDSIKNVKRPFGFPRLAWNEMSSKAPGTAGDVSQRWEASRTKNEHGGYQIVADVLGIPIDSLFEVARRKANEHKIAAQASASRHVVINCDGLCEPVNPGGTATYGFVARRGNELLVQDFGVVASGPGATNNVAEYAAVSKAIEWAIGALPGGEKIVIRTDSQLVVRQIKGEYAVRSERIRPLYQVVCSLLSRLRQSHKVDFEWVPRERNVEADKLSRMAYSNAGTDASAKRSERAVLLTGGVRQVGQEKFAVQSSSGHVVYLVDLDAGSCTCPDYQRRRRECKHIIATGMALAEQSLPLDGLSV